MTLKLFVVPSHVGDSAALTADVRRWEDLGVGGVLLTDHLFVGEHTTLDPIVVLAAVAARSEHLAIGTLVANIGLAHPALTLRHFAQLAALFGGERVYAGLGAGWNAEEFDALGQEMAPHGVRVERLEGALRLGRELFSDGQSSASTSTFTTLRLPASPRPSQPPRLLVGGGSDELLRVAGQWADHIDLNGSSRRRRVGRSAAARSDGIRRLETTVADLEQSVGLLSEAARLAGRDPMDIGRSVFIDTVVDCPDDEVGMRGAAVCAERGLSPSDALDATSCPYLLLGSPAQQRDALGERQARLGLTHVIVNDGPHVGELVEVAGAL